MCKLPVSVTGRMDKRRLFLYGRSLLDSKLFKSDKVLTSTGIQHRYQLAVRERAAKNPITAEAKFWLLSKEETESFIKVCLSDGFSGKNGSCSEKNDDFSGNNPIKESKEKESKGK